MTQENIGTLKSYLDMENGQFNAAITQATEKLSSAQAKMNRSLAAIESKFNAVDKSVLAAKDSVVGLASGYFTFNFVKSAIDGGDHINDLSKQTGVAVETLSTLSLAADQSGTSIDDVAVSINKMQKNLSEAAHGSKTAAEAFSQIGLSVNDLAKLSPEEQFLKIAGQISKIGNESDRTRALMDIFGKSGAGLAPLMSEGAEGIRKMMERAKELGIVLTQEQAAKMDAYNDHMAELTHKLKILAVDGFLFAWDAAKKFNEELSSITGNYDGLDKGEMLRIRGNNAGKIQVVEQQIKTLKDNNADVNYDLLYKQLDDLKKEQNDLTNRITSLDKEAQPDKKSDDKITLKPDEKKSGLSDAQKAYNDRLKEAEKVYNDTRTAAEKYSAEVDNLLLEDLITDDTYTRGIEKAGKAYEDATNKSSGLKDAAKDLGLTFSSAFEDAIVKGEKFSTVLSSLAQDVAKLALRKGLTEPFVNFFTDSLGSIFGGGRANGGRVTAGMSYDVGEFGRERFYPDTNGTIVPYDQIGSSGGDYHIQQNFTFPQGAGQGGNNAALMNIVARAAEESARKVFAEETRNQMRIGGLFNQV